MSTKERGHEDRAGDGRGRLWQLILVLALACIVLARLPFLSNTLVGEEGYFAALAVDSGKPASLRLGEALVVGRLHGKEITVPPEHPILPYALLGRVWRKCWGQKEMRESTLAAWSLRARTPYFILFLAGLLLLLAGCRRQLFGSGACAGPLPTFLIAFVLLSPLVVGGSIQPQLDGSIGALLVCSAGFFLTRSDRSPTVGKACMWAAGAGVVAAMGKNEWTLAFAAALLLVGLARWKMRSSRRFTAWPILAALAGVMIGSIIHYSIDPANYLGGLHVMRRTSVYTSSWGTTFQSRLFWVWPLFSLIVLAVWMLWRTHSVHAGSRYGESTILLWGLALTAGFFLSPWNGDGFPRYFCPPLLVILFWYILVLERTPLSRRARFGLTAALVAGTLFHLTSLYGFARDGVSITSHPGRNLSLMEARWQSQKAQQQRTGRPAITDAAFGYYYPDTDYLALSLGDETAKKLLREHGWR
ncbi:MAG: hypothetical protein ACE5F1_08410 [Planctomycetota bacterium]